MICCNCPVQNRIRTPGGEGMSTFTLVPSSRTNKAPGRAICLIRRLPKQSPDRADRTHFAIFQVRKTAWGGGGEGSGRRLKAPLSTHDRVPLRNLEVQVHVEAMSQMKSPIWTKVYGSTSAEFWKKQLNALQVFTSLLKAKTSRQGDACKVSSVTFLGRLSKWQPPTDMLHLNMQMMLMERMHFKYVCIGEWTPSM